MIEDNFGSLLNALGYLVASLFALPTNLVFFVLSLLGFAAEGA